MDTIQPVSDIGLRPNFQRHVRARDRRIRLRRILRGGAGILAILLVWQVM